MQIQERERTVQLVFDLRIDISSVKSIHESVLPLLARDLEAWSLDGTQVEKVDAAGLQLLLSLTRTLRARGVSWHWSACSAAMCRAAGLLGLTQELGLINGKVEPD
jgi:anti-anti-sigma regulatory factor